VCGTGIDPDARPVLRELRRGSTLRKIPAALLDRYRAPRRTRTPDTVAPPEGGGA
jgi:adenine-specific DNA-methyltransferase